MEFKNYKMEDIATFSQGKQVEIENQYTEKKENMRRFLRIIDFTNPNEPIRYVEDFGDRYYAKKDDLVMIRYGSQTCGKVVIGKEGIIANNMFKINLDNSIVLNRYAYYYLKQDIVYNYLRGSQNSSTMPSINFGILNKLEIEVPSIDNQKKIVKILNDIDEKIDLNNQINNNLHELVKYEYYERFIVNKRDDWKEDTLGNFLSIDRGLSYKGQFLSDNGVPMINLGNVMPNGVFRIEKNKYYSGDFKEKVTTKVGDIVLANTDMTQNREVIGTPVIVPPIYDGKIIFSHHIYCLRDLKLPKMFIFYTLLTDDWNAAAGGNATGTTVLALPKNTIENYIITIPDNESLAIFDNIATSIQEKRELIMLENIKLEELRDTLLPKLMNGEIDLDNIEV